MIFTFETYVAAHKRIVKQRHKAMKQAAISPMALDRAYRLAHIHDLILQRLELEIEEWEWF
ncbi:hypothetical protein PP914_gp168 [Arthrobacter phage Qui]|uniref:Uncharacterized protein n=1 Tax=Arthrobacter phage Qui TaxID=2603260 RepID=A0A5B8WK94_9CAUD|nr:hypothetical protein PP914_gp168 [Arthrobacter phage Qui]QED11656.1 hypothetical protein SEA_QUI_168 [Arthrobacter phage Qui]QOC56487.1 hypothetical protein SEA_PAELLA_168 [Arthrobacter phage Paella]